MFSLCSEFVEVRIISGLSHLLDLSHRLYVRLSARSAGSGQSMRIELWYLVLRVHDTGRADAGSEQVWMLLGDPGSHCACVAPSGDHPRNACLPRNLCLADLLTQLCVLLVDEIDQVGDRMSAAQVCEVLGRERLFVVAEWLALAVESVLKLKYGGVVLLGDLAEEIIVSRRRFDSSLATDFDDSRADSGWIRNVLVVFVVALVERFERIRPESEVI